MLSTTFTNFDGSNWPAPWVTSLDGGTTGGVIDVQTSRGRMRANDGGYRAARAAASGVSAIDATFTATFNLQGVTEQYAYLWFRTSGDWYLDDGDGASDTWKKDGYALVVGAYPDGGLSFARTVNRVEANLAGVPFAFTAGVDYKAKISFVGTSLRAKVWLASGSEPATWTVQGSDATYTSGGIGVSLLSGKTAADRQWTLDDIVVTAVTAATASPSEYTAYLQATTDLDPGGALPSLWTAYAQVTTDAVAAPQVRKLRRAGAWVDTSDRKLRRNGVWV
jgi:hypothetical protein